VEGDGVRAPARAACRVGQGGPVAGVAGERGSPIRSSSRSGHRPHARNLLVDDARRAKAGKRGGDGGRVALIEAEAALPCEWDPDEVLWLDDAVTELARIDPDLALVLELRYFGGLEVEETARKLGRPKRTVERRLQQALAWLRSRRAEP